jgi:hypothetical protein
VEKLEEREHMEDLVSKGIIYIKMDQLKFNGLLIKQVSNKMNQRVRTKIN